VEGATPAAVMPPDLAAVLRRNDRQVIETGETLEFEETVEHEGQRHTYLSVKFPLRHADGTVYGVCGISTDITGRKRAEALLEERLRFEELVSELSARFIAAPAHEVDACIEEGLRRIATFLDVDRSTFFGVSPDGDVLVTHAYAASAVPQVPVRPLQDVFPWSMAQLRQGRCVVIDTAEDWPEEAAVDRASFQHFGMQSSLAIPIRVGDMVQAVLGVGSLRAQRNWPEALLGRLRLVGEIFAGAIARRRAAEAIQESEARFRALADSMPVLVWMSGPDKEGVFFNRTWLAFTGRSHDEERGEGWLASVHPDDGARLREQCAAAFARREPFEARFRLRRADGTYRWMLDTGSPRFAPDGGFAGYVGSCIDVTEQIRVEQELKQLNERLEERVAERTAALADANAKLRQEMAERRQAEHALRASEHKYRRLFNAASDAIVIFEPEREEILEVNRQACELYGFSRAELIGRSLRSFTHDVDRGRREVQRLLRRGQTRDFETVQFRRDGTPVQILASAAVIDFEGRTAILSINRDVTDRARMLEEVQRREERTRLLYQVTSQTARSIGDQLQEALKLTTNLLGLGAGILSHVDGQVYTIVDCYALEAAIWPGQTFDLGDTYCSTTLAADDVVAIDHVGRSPHRRHPCYQALGLESYIGIPVHVSGTAYGTLNFSAARPRSQPFSEGDRDLIRLLGQWVGSAIERRQAEEALRLSEERFAKSFSANPVAATVSTLAEGRFVDVNASFLALTGYAPEEIVGRTVADLDLFVVPRGRKQIIKVLLQEGGYRNLELQVRDKSGQVRDLLASGEVIDFGGERCVLTMSYDITERKRLEREVLEISAREQRRIGQDLHDELGQKLTGIAFLSKVLQDELVKEASPQAASMQQITEFIGETLAYTRDLARMLSPVEMLADGLVDALSRLAEQTQRVFGVTCRLGARHPLIVEDNQTATHLYRIAQEAVNNAVKHARAREICIDLLEKPGEHVLRIADDGVGIDEQRLQASSGMGLRTMRYRADLIAATLTVEAGAEGGTVVECRFTG
jgi:PAS domain S-box-containing protein